MEPNLEYDWVALGANLQISGSFVFAERCGSGHIHDTFVACYDQEGRRVRYIHQRINQTVFKDPVSLMDNFARVTAHIQSKLLLAGADQIERRVLKLIPTIEGKTYLLLMGRAIIGAPIGSLRTRGHMTRFNLWSKLLRQPKRLALFRSCWSICPGRGWLKPFLIFIIPHCVLEP